MYNYCIFSNILSFLSKCPPGMKQQVLTFYTKLLAHIRQPLLPHINVHRPVQVSCHLVCVCPLFKQTVGNNATVTLLFSEIDPPVRGGSGSPHGKRRDPVPLYSLCQTQAGPVPCQLLPGGRSFNRTRPTTTASLQSAVVGGESVQSLPATPSGQTTLRMDRTNK